MHSTVISAPIGIFAARATKSAVTKHERGKGCSEEEARAIGDAAGAVAGASASIAMSVLLLDPFASSITLARRTRQFKKARRTLAAIRTA